MKYIMPTIGYFLMWGTVYGLVLGAWSTTIMLPIIGTFFGLWWGAGIGAACGFLCGLLVSVIQAYTFHPDVNMPGYRVRISIIVGIMVGIMAPVLLLLTSQGILWGSGGLQVFLLPSLIAVIFWGSLSAAYVGHGYPLWLARARIGKIDPSDHGLGLMATMDAITRSGIVHTALALGGIIGLVMAAAEVVRYTSRGSYDVPGMLIGYLPAGGVAGITMTVAAILILCSGVAVLIVFLKRVLFASNTLAPSSHTEHLILTGSAFLFTGLICVWPAHHFSASISGAWALPLLCAAVMGFYVYRVLDLDHTDKAKRKAKESL